MICLFVFITLRDTISCSGYFSRKHVHVLLWELSLMHAVNKFKFLLRNSRTMLNKCLSVAYDAW